MGVPFSSPIVEVECKPRDETGDAERDGEPTEGNQE
jgi:hypothetical protein